MSTLNMALVSTTLTTAHGVDLDPTSMPNSLLGFPGLPTALSSRLVHQNHVGIRIPCFDPHSLMIRPFEALGLFRESSCS